MTKGTPLRKLLWAVDPYSERTLQTKMASTLKGVFRSMPVPTDLVYILSEGHNEISLSKYPHWEEVDESEVKTRLRKISMTLGGAPGKAHILRVKSRSTRDAVAALLRLASREKAGAIAVATHGRKGVDRFFLGSFAETLMMQSHVPLLAINPSVHHLRKVSRLLYATDLSLKSRKITPLVLDLAKQFDCPVTVFHKLLEYKLVPPPGFVLRNLMDQLKEETTKKAGLFLKHASARGIPTELVLEESSPDLVSAIVKQAGREKSSLLVLEARRGRMASLVLGSTARRVIRECPSPVWVIPRRESK